MEISVKVLRIFNNLVNGWSRVMVDNDTYSLISESNQAIVDGVDPLLAPIANSLKNEKGIYFSKYQIGDVQIMYRYNSKAPRNADGKKYKHEFYMFSTVAKDLLVESTATEIEFNTDEVLAVA